MAAGSILAFAIVLLGARNSAHGSALPSTVVVVNQVGDWTIPQAPIIAAAESWGLPWRYGGPASCLASAPGTITVCVTVEHPSVNDDTGGPWPAKWWSEWWPGRGIGLAPRLVGAPAWQVQEAVAHELGNALGVPTEPCGVHNVMALCMSGYLNPPPHRA